MDLLLPICVAFAHKFDLRPLSNSEKLPNKSLEIMLKNFNSFDRKILYSAILLFFLFSFLVYDDSFILGLTGSQGEFVGAIEFREKDVRTKASNDFRYVNARNSNLFMGDSIFTGPNSKAGIRLPSGDLIEIQENSLITFTKVGNQMILSLKSGQLKGASKSIRIVANISNPYDRAQAKAKEVKLAPPQQRNLSSIEEVKPKIVNPRPYEVRTFNTFFNGLPSVPTTIEVFWQYPKESVKYDFQVAGDADFHKIEFAESTTATNMTTPELKPGPHFMRVRETEKPWSQSVQVVIQIAPPELSNTLARPRLERPFTEYIISKNPLQLRWYEVPEANQYLVEVSEDAEFTASRKILTTETQFVVEDSQPGKLHYRVSAVSGRKLSYPSDTGQAVTMVAPPSPRKTPDLTYLAKNENDLGPAQEVNLAWSAVPYAKKYKVFVAYDEQFTNPKVIETTETSIRYQLEKPGKYFWQVQAETERSKPISQASNASDVNYQYFPPLAAPQPLLPRTNITLFFQSREENPFYFVWKPVEHAKEYHLQIAEDPSFSTILAEPKSSETKFLISKKLKQGPVYWRVQAITEDRTSMWSSGQNIKIFAGKTARGE
jgi:hypothetical protein